MIPVTMPAVAIIDGYMHCGRHDIRLDFHPDRKATSPVDMTQWYRCPGLIKELDDPDRESELKRNAQRLVDSPHWGKALSNDERPLAALDQIIEEADYDDRCSWQFVIEIEDASVTVG